jgi:SAM-dependent methyltransferase
MNSKNLFYPEAKFGGYTDIDGTVVFYSRVNALLKPSFTTLNVGCGRGASADDGISFRRSLGVLKGKVARAIGVDVDPAAKDNPFLDEFHLVSDNGWPIENDSIDLIVCDNVLEHIENTEQFFSETQRVLKDGGYLCLRTPNRWSYIAIAATLIPNSLHSKVTSFVQESRMAEDVFPTLYRCNSVRKLKNAMRRAGFDSVVYGYEAEPSYLSFSTIAYFFGVLHQMFAPGFMRPSLFAFGKIKKT